MSIFKRLRDLTVASVNDVIDNLEDPVAMLTQYMRDMEVEIGRVEVTVARQIAEEKKFYQQLQEARAMVEKRDRQVLLALQQGEDELARRALIDKKQYESRAAEYEALYKTASEAAQQLKAKLAELKDEFYKMRAKKYTLMSRAQVARTQKQINQAVTGMGCDTAMRGFARMEEKVVQMEAEAELSGQYKGLTSLDYSFRNVERNDEIERELAQLRVNLRGNKERTEAVENIPELTQK